MTCCCDGRDEHLGVVKCGEFLTSCRASGFSRTAPWCFVCKPVDKWRGNIWYALCSAVHVQHSFARNVYKYSGPDRIALGWTVWQPVLAQGSVLASATSVPKNNS